MEILFFHVSVRFRLVQNLRYVFELSLKIEVEDARRRHRLDENRQFHDRNGPVNNGAKTAREEQEEANAGRGS